MAKFPEPPPVDRLAQVKAAWKILPAGTELWRIYFRSGPQPTSWNELRSFGPTDSRFDHHPEPRGVHDEAILYAALDMQSTIAEVFQRRRRIHLRRNAPWLVAFELASAVRLLDLGGTWTTRAGASMALASGSRDRARRWSRAIHAAYPEAQGLYYPSSMNAGKPLVALYERAEPALPTRPVFHRALADRALLTVLRNAAIDLGYRMF